MRYALCAMPFVRSTNLVAYRSVSGKKKSAIVKVVKKVKKVEVVELWGHRYKSQL